MTGEATTPWVAPSDAAGAFDAVAASHPTGPLAMASDHRAWLAGLARHHVLVSLEGLVGAEGEPRPDPCVAEYARRLRAASRSMTADAREAVEATALARGEVAPRDASSPVEPASPAEAAAAEVATRALAERLQGEVASAGLLAVWVVHGPDTTDQPGLHVARLHAVGDPGAAPPCVGALLRAGSLEQVRRLLPRGLHRQCRAAADAPTILEVHF